MTPEIRFKKIIPKTLLCEVYRRLIYMLWAFLLFSFVFWCPIAAFKPPSQHLVP